MVSARSLSPPVCLCLAFCFKMPNANNIFKFIYLTRFSSSFCVSVSRARVIDVRYTLRCSEWETPFWGYYCWTYFVMQKSDSFFFSETEILCFFRCLSLLSIRLYARIAWIYFDEQFHYRNWKSVVDTMCVIGRYWWPISCHITVDFLSMWIVTPELHDDVVNVPTDTQGEWLKKGEEGGGGGRKASKWH